MTTKREAENGPVPERPAYNNRGKSLTDANVINAMTLRFNISSREACDLIMRVAENMRKAA